MQVQIKCPNCGHVNQVESARMAFAEVLFCDGETGGCDKEYIAKVVHTVTVTIHTAKLPELVEQERPPIDSVLVVGSGSTPSPQGITSSTDGARKPLTDREIYDVMSMGVVDPESFDAVVNDSDWPVAKQYVRDIEAALGIGE